MYPYRDSEVTLITCPEGEVDSGGSDDGFEPIIDSATKERDIKAFEDKHNTAYRKYFPDADVVGAKSYWVRNNVDPESAPEQKMNLIPSFN